jgi:hypothetical protein
MALVVTVRLLANEQRVSVRQESERSKGAQSVGCQLLATALLGILHTRLNETGQKELDRLGCAQG